MRIIVLLLLLWVAGCIAAIAAPQASAATNDLVKGRNLYFNKCGRCHKFYDPTKYDDKKWSEWMGKMLVKAKLSDEQYKLLSNYLQSVRHAENEKPGTAK